MTDPESVAPEVLQNLLHADLAIRKTGLKQLKEQWTIKFREYLWMAIEKEKHKSFQADMVKFALTTLKDKSLRKMIRFVEKDQLFPRSRNYLITTYIEEETDIVRKALVKSLKRSHSQTYRFVCALLQDRFLTTELDRDAIQSLVHDILQEGIPDQHRQEMLVAVMNRYFTERYFQDLVRPLIWDLIEDHPHLYFAILRVYFNPVDELELNVVKPKKNKPKLMWESWKWIIPGEDQDFNEYQDIFGYNEELVLNARHSVSSKVRQEFIRVIAHQYISTKPPAVETEGYLSNLYQVWDQVVKHDLELVFKELDEVTGEVLQEVFDDQLIMEDGSNPTLFRLMQIHQINPHDLIARIIAYYPRTLLLEVGTSDNDEETRVLTLEQLNRRSFFMYTSNNGTTTLRGPPQFWIQIFDHALLEMRKELSISHYDAITDLIFNLVGYLSDHPDSLICKQVREKIDTRQKQIDELSAFDQGLPIFYKLMAFLGPKNYVIPVNTNLTDKQKLLLLEDFLTNIVNETAQQSIVNLIENASYEVLEYARELTSVLVKDTDQSTTGKKKDHLIKIVNSLLSCADVRVRTKSHLLKQRLIKYWSEEEFD